MDEVIEKRGPIEKTQKGWPVNPLGVAALIVFGLIIIFLIAKPLISQKPTSFVEQQTSKGGKILTPLAGEIVKSEKLTIELSVDEPDKVQKVEFWAKTYADGKWEMIGEVASAPYKLHWSIPSQFQNKAIAITSHITQEDGQVIKDPGGWREGIIILSQ